MTRLFRPLGSRNPDPRIARGLDLPIGKRITWAPLPGPEEGYPAVTDKRMSAQTENQALISAVFEDQIRNTC